MKEPQKKPRRRIKKVKGHGGHHGGAWKVAYADFVTAMMALFLVLWLVSQADTKLKQAIANYFRAPGVFDTLQGGIIEGPKKVSKEPSPMTSKDEEQALYNTAEILRKKFETRPEFGKYKDQIKIEITEEGLRIQLLDQAERVSFASGSAQLTPDANSILGVIAQGVCELPNPILIGGHTDRRIYPEGSTYTNWELSADRANAARRALEANCVQPGQIRRIVGYADTELFVPEDPYAAANRRISITVMRMNTATEPAVATKPGDDNNKTTTTSSSLTEKAEPPKAHNPPAEERASKPQPDAGGKTVSIGEPDQIPQSVRRTRESAPPKQPPPPGL
ncbi:MAG TPA: flagellar motor protein MotB [Pyrinomonadaceae bacterium]|nr:flagellar motor protein MotB [Pyrinomonadaceae bacterium]